MLRFLPVSRPLSQQVRVTVTLQRARFCYRLFCGIKRGSSWAIRLSVNSSGTSLLIVKAEGSHRLFCRGAGHFSILFPGSGASAESWLWAASLSLHLGKEHKPWREAFLVLEPHFRQWPASLTLLPAFWRIRQRFLLGMSRLKPYWTETQQ